MPDTKFLQIQTTTDNEANARTIAQYLIENHLAACVQIVQPVTSYYFWEGKLATGSEFLLLIKATCENYSVIEKALQKLHHYQLPEIIALPILAGENKYLAWLQAECREAE